MILQDLGERVGNLPASAVNHGVAEMIKMVWI